MKVFRFCSTLIIFLAISKTASAIDWGITDVRANNEYSRGSVWSGRFKSYNGTSYNVSDFYKNKNLTLTFHQTLYVDLQDTVLFLPMYFDNGYESDLLTAEPLLAFGLGIQKKINNLTMELVGKNLLRIGGSTSEQPCFDSFRRQYHCGTGLAWSDSSSVHLKHDLEPTFNFVLKYAF